MIGPWFTAGPAFQWLADHMPEKGSPGEVIPLVEPHDIEKFEERDVLPLDKPD